MLRMKHKLMRLSFFVHKSNGRTCEMQSTHGRLFTACQRYHWLRATDKTISVFLDFMQKGRLPPSYMPAQ